MGFNIAKRIARAAPSSPSKRAVRAIPQLHVGEQTVQASHPAPSLAAPAKRLAKRPPPLGKDGNPVKRAVKNLNAPKRAY